jgi:hypothetical protein
MRRDPRRKTTAAAAPRVPIYISFPFFLLVVVVERLAEAGGARLPVVARGHVKTRWVDGFRLQGPPVTGPYRDDRRDAMRRSRRPGSCVCLPFSVFDSKKNAVACVHVCMHNNVMEFIHKPIQGGNIRVE